MIVSFSTIEDVGAGFRAKLFMPRWRTVKAQLYEVESPKVPAIDARIIIGKVSSARTIVGMEGPSFVVETRIPIDEFKLLSIRGKCDLVLDSIFESINAVLNHFGEHPSERIHEIWSAARRAA